MSSDRAPLVGASSRLLAIPQSNRHASTFVKLRKVKTTQVKF